MLLVFPSIAIVLCLIPIATGLIPPTPNSSQLESAVQCITREEHRHLNRWESASGARACGILATEGMGA